LNWAIGLQITCGKLRKLAWPCGELFAELMSTRPNNDFNISPRHYAYSGESAEFRPIAEIIEELATLEEEAIEINARLMAQIKRIAV
jgi:hypothetical protein